MTDIEKSIREILNMGLNCNLNHYLNLSHTTISTPSGNTKLYIFPDSIGVPIPSYLIKPIDLVNRLKNPNSLPGVIKYFIFLDKDEHFNNEVLGIKVIPFELNHLVQELFDLANKIVESNNV